MSPRPRRREIGFPGIIQDPAVRLDPKDRMQREASIARKANCRILFQLGHGTLVKASQRQFTKIAKSGLRIKTFPKSDILKLGAYSLNFKRRSSRLPAGLSIPKKFRKEWPHYLVQLAGPPITEWVRDIENCGARVVERLGVFSLFLHANPKQMQAVASLPFVAWTGPFQPAYRISPGLKRQRGRIEGLNIGIYPAASVSEVTKELKKQKGKVLRQWTQKHFAGLLVEIDAKKIPFIVRLPNVRWIEHEPFVPFPLDERSGQIIAGNLDNQTPPDTAPVTGYQDQLDAYGLSGAGVTVGICDTGVDTNDNTTMHPDLQGRLAYFEDASNGQITQDGWYEANNPNDKLQGGHGTHVAGIAVGNGASGNTDPEGFALGLGIAPGADFGSLNFLVSAMGQGIDQWVEEMTNHGTDIMNNSWAYTISPGSGYTSKCQLFDQMARDPNPSAANFLKMAIVCAAGNAGPEFNTCTEPHEAKNPIIVGNSCTHRPNESHSWSSTNDDIRGISLSSSRGPAMDGRFLPTIVAPGTDIISARSSVDADPNTSGVQPPRPAYTDTGGTVHNQHTPATGTSMAAPQVSGLCALLIEWWRNRTGGQTPSPALLKALLINGAVDLSGGPSGRTDTGGNDIPVENIPNNDQGWGRVNLRNIVEQNLNNNRGPKLFIDQRQALTGNGQEYRVRLSPADTARPLRITLVWTDPPGPWLTSHALVNDLDLEVAEIDTGNIYKGNINFNNGFSSPANASDPADADNNVECVFLQNPQGMYDVRVIAADITTHALPPYSMSDVWQDFALVIDNAEIASPGPVSIVPVIDRSGSMKSFGYMGMTKTSTKQFVDLMSINDKLAMVSFGSTAQVHYPTGTPPALQMIDSPDVRSDASTAVDGINFGGSTFMGGGIQKAHDLLAPESGARAMVLLSDGYDNRGYNDANPWAVDVVAGLPADLPVYTCAMGPLSDQDLLSEIAGSTGGRYYYMPAIDDLFEIYNYIRGQVSGESIVANESAQASFGCVEALVDATAESVCFSVAWADSDLNFTPEIPSNPTDIRIRLRDPRGKYMPENDSYITRIIGQGYLLFKIHTPAPGKWRVDVDTAKGTHVRFTVGAFVKSPLRIMLPGLPYQIHQGLPVDIIANISHGNTLASDVRASVNVISPKRSIADLAIKYRIPIRKLRIPQNMHKSTVPDNYLRVGLLRNKLLKAGKPDIFQTVKSQLSLSKLPVQSHNLVQNSSLLPVASGNLNTRFYNTKKTGTYNFKVTVSGVCPVTKTRFVRKGLRSVFVK